MKQKRLSKQLKANLICLIITAFIITKIRIIIIDDIVIIITTNPAAKK